MLNHLVDNTGIVLDDFDNLSALRVLCGFYHEGHKGFFIHYVSSYSITRLSPFFNSFSLKLINNPTLVLLNFM